MFAIQMSFSFTPITPPPESEQALEQISWRDVSEIAHSAGFNCPCLVSAGLHDELLDDQALYDALWTACFTLSLNNRHCALFTIELDGKPTRFKTLKTNHVTYLGRVEDF